MAPRLRVLAGPSLQALEPISVNSDTPHRISSDAFDGQVIAYIKGFPDIDGKVLQHEYFERDERKGVTWSIQVQGRFLQPHSADDIMFGNTFDRPLKLPWGTSAALTFMKFIDPTLTHDLVSKTKPWALSPLISTMPYFSHSRAPTPPASFPLPSHRSIQDDTSQLVLSSKSLAEMDPSPTVSDHSSSYSTMSTRSPSTSSSRSSSSSSVPTVASTSSAMSSRSSLSSTFSAFSSSSKLSTSKAEKKEKKSRSTVRKSHLDFSTPNERRSYFAQVDHRNEIVFGPEDTITTDFCYGFLEFSPTLALRLPGGMSFDLMRYWDGQPVRFVCCERKKTSSKSDDADDTPWGRVLWCVAIVLADDDDLEGGAN